ncbi:MAG: DUF1648 domain-containing protein [Candidatus Micrarchaeia archaeon]
MVKNTKMENTFTHLPLSKQSKIIILLSLIITVLAVIVLWNNYNALPNTVAIHYGLNGQPNAYGPKAALLIPTTLLILITFLFILILRFRYTLIEKYPYLINLPSFVYKIGFEKNKKVKSELINKVFTVYTLSILYISILNLLITFSISTSNASLLLPSLFVIIIIFVVSVLALYRNIYKAISNKK